MKAPYVWFGGKSKVAPVIWERLGNVPNFVDPFMGSNAVLLSRPEAHRIDGAWPVETVNDIDGMVANFWRALQAAPEAVARYADWPANENDLHARHSWLVRAKPGLVERLEGDPEYYDAKIAGWWVWGMALWIGGGFCSGEGSWQSVDGRLVQVDGDAGQGVQRRRLHLSAGQGVQRKLLHLGSTGRGVQRQRLDLGSSGRGVRRASLTDLYGYMAALSDRMKRVRVASGDWRRVLGPSPTWSRWLTGIILDPPYAHSERDDAIYAHDHDVSEDVRAWAIENGDNPLLRIVYCGYDDGRDMPGWSTYRWQAHGGYGVMQGDTRGRANREREVVWFSPHCLKPEAQLTLWGANGHTADV